MAQIHFEVPDMLHRQIKLACTRAGVSMSDVLRSAAAAFVKAEGDNHEFRELHPEWKYYPMEGPLVIEFEVADAAREEGGCGKYTSMIRS